MLRSPLRWVVLIYVVTRLLNIVTLEFGSRFEPDIEWHYSVYAREMVDAYNAGQNPLQAVEIEYPILSLALMVPPELGARALLPEDATTRGHLNAYYTLFRLQLFIIDLLGIWIMSRIVGWLYPNENMREHAIRLGLLVLTTGILGTLVYSRLDYPLGLLVALSLGLLLTQRTHLSRLLIAVGILFKLIPVILVPVWVVAEMRGRWNRFDTWVRQLIPLTEMVGTVLVVCGLLWAVAGPTAFYFITYHRDRGIEIGSIMATVALTAGQFGAPLSYDDSYGSFNVRSSLTPILVGVAPVLCIVLLAIPGLRLFLMQLRERNPLSKSQPGTVILTTVAMSFGFIVGNKVFSPQYMLWLIPLVVLLPVTGRRQTWLFALFLLLVGLTQVYWNLFATLILVYNPETNVGGPTIYAYWLLLVRNLLMLFMTFELNRILWQRTPEGTNPS